MEKHEVYLELVRDGELVSRIFCTAKAAKYLLIGFGLEPRPVVPPVLDSVELLPDGDIKKIAKK